MTIYPQTSAERSRWILDRRGSRNALDPLVPYAYFVEEEASFDGRHDEVATIFLTNRECPWRCLMCDLWQNTLEETVPIGAIPSQIQHALADLPQLSFERSAIKLYNAGSFFDPQAIPPADYPSIAKLCGAFRRVIVEAHPSLVGERCLIFRDMLTAKLEVAMGLETAHPEVLERLNKRMTLAQFRKAADLLCEQNIDLRVFILVRPPWLSEREGVDWAKRSIDFAFDCSASVCSLISTRAGNGAMDELSRSDEFSPPSIRSLEIVQEYGLSLGRGRVFADLWDAEKCRACPACKLSRIERIRTMNSRQSIPTSITCDHCQPECGEL